MEQQTIAIIGSGSWATAIAKIVTDNGHPIIWWVRKAANIDYFLKRKHNPHYLRNTIFDTSKIQFSDDIKEVVGKASLLIFAVPSMHLESTLEPLSSNDFENKKVISAIKGVIPKYNILLHQHLEKEFKFPLSHYFTLLGPSHAEEVASEQLSYLTFSGVDKSATASIADLFKSSYINTITNDDVLGVQYAGVVKNIYALGAGIAYGLEYGDNFLSVYIANCAQEMQLLLTTIIQQYSENETTVNYNSSVYLGDLLVTCYSLHSRNRTFGNMIGKGYSVRSAVLELNMVAEGYNASKCIVSIIQSLKLELPIVQTIYEILWEGASPKNAFKQIEKRLI